MIILGMNYTTNANGGKNTTLHVAEEFDVYYNSASDGRGCVGQKVDSVYVGNYDCTTLKVGLQIEVLYAQAISTKNGIFQPIKRIDILSK